MQQDYYEILGVAKNADQDTIKKAYRKLAMQFHPDKNPGNSEAEEKFKKAAEAYEILGNPEKRAKYDQFGHSAFRGGMGGGQQFHDMEDIFAQFGDIFGDFFGGGASSRRRKDGPRQGSNLRYVLDIDFKESIEGLEKEIKYNVEDNCGACNGSGSEKGHDTKTCTDCRGSGQVVRMQGFFSVASTCGTCRGSGKIITHPCKKCKGSGRSQIERKLKVKVPPGVDTGTRLRLTGEGEGGYRGGPSGDLYVEIRVKEDSLFTRRGDDLYGQVKISYTQAALGAKLELDTFRGKETLDIAAGTQPGELVTLAGKGAPSLRGYGRGDMHFQVVVDIPKKLNKEEEKLLKEIAQLKNESTKTSVTGFFSKLKDDIEDIIKH